MHAAQTTEAIDRNTNTFEIGKFDAPIIANHYVLNMPTTIDERPDLSSYLVGQLCELTRKFRGQDLMRSYSPGVKFFYAAKLIRLETRGVSYYVLDGSCPPVTQLTDDGAETR